MAAIFKKNGIHFIRFTDSSGVERVMTLKEGRKYLMEEFEKRKRSILNCKKVLQNQKNPSAKLSIFFTTHNNLKGNVLTI